MRGKTSEAGHGLGPVYYAMTWTVLAYIFFDHRVIIAIGILAMSYGDGMASLLGTRFGKQKYHIFHDMKSYIGSIVMFVCTFLLLVVALLFYAQPVTLDVIVCLVCIAGVATLVEGVTPFGLDNLSVPFVTVVLFWVLLVR